MKIPFNYYQDLRGVQSGSAQLALSYNVPPSNSLGTDTINSVAFPRGIMWLLQSQMGTAAFSQTSNTVFPPTGLLTHASATPILSYTSYAATSADAYSANISTAVWFDRGAASINLGTGGTYAKAGVVVNLTQSLQRYFTFQNKNYDYLCVIKPTHVSVLMQSLGLITVGFQVSNLVLTNSGYEKKVLGSNQNCQLAGNRAIFTAAVNSGSSVSPNWDIYFNLFPGDVYTVEEIEFFGKIEFYKIS